MALEELKAQIALLMEEMVNQPQDRHELLEQLRERLNEMRAMGLPLPEDLVALERDLEFGEDVAPEAATDIDPDGAPAS